MSKTTKVTLPSLLSFERKLETSDALMYSANWADVPTYPLEIKKDKKGNEIESPWQNIKVTKRYNRSTQSAAGILDDKKIEANPVSSDSDDANLPSGADTLKVSFTLRVIGNVGKPFACNSPTFESAITKKVTEFKDESQLKILASRYAYNIANGRFLWRNRVCANNVHIHVFIDEVEKPLVFDAYTFSLNDFDKNSDSEDLKTLSKYIQSGLNSEEDFVFLKVDAYVHLGENQHVYPSEEMNMKEQGKTLFQLGDKNAAMHNVKIGNAIRTIDDWYSTDILIKNPKDDKKAIPHKITENDIRPIAIEPYGSVTQRGAAYRPSKNDLYTKMLDWLNNADTVDENDKSYVVANLIRGGVFSKGSK